ncbi:MAG TPA: hypothetical protein VK034_31110, partial [Enhygromyxa sp.]|nr:hypothetical protein [Enhygromyxa sp.]
MTSNRYNGFMVNRSQFQRIALLGAKPRIIARSLKIAIALSPALYGSGCDQGESMESADPGFGLELEVTEVVVSPERVRFKAGPHQLELALVRNSPLLAPNAVVVRDGVELTPDQAGLEIPYRGYVVGDPKSWIRVRLTDTGFDGLIYTNEGLWEVRQDETGEILMTHSSLDDYLEIDGPESQPTCASSDAEAAHATYAYDNGPLAKAASCKQINIALV